VSHFHDMLSTYADLAAKAICERREMLTLCAMMDRLPALKWETHRDWAGGTMELLLSSRRPVAGVWRGWEDGLLVIRAKYYGPNSLALRPPKRVTGTSRTR